MDGTDINSLTYGTYTTGGTSEKIYEIVTTYETDDLSTLRFTQSADVVTIVHSDYVPRELTRSGDTNWSIDDKDFEPAQPAPTNLTGSAGSAATWVVTAVNEENFEESLASNSFTGAATPNTLSWTAATGASQYNVYKIQNGIYGLVGVAGSTSFADSGITPDLTINPPTARNPFSGAGNFPSTVAYIQQRLSFANTDNDPEKVWMSRVGKFGNFTKSPSLQDDDAVDFIIAGAQVNEVRHLFDLGRLIAFTSSSNYLISGDASGIITPTDINLRQQEYYGANNLSPIGVGSSGLYVQSQGSIIRDLNYNFNRDGYDGNDLTIFSNHLFDNYNLTDWAYQGIHHSIVWVVRNDGMLLGMTYVPDQQLIAWHRHDTDGTFENVTSVPEGTEDFVYFIVNRTINGRTVRYIERMKTRLVDPENTDDLVFMDSALTYDGRNTTATSMTLSGGTTWSHEETLTLTASASFFTSSDVGNEIQLTGADGGYIFFKIFGFTSDMIVTGKSHKTVPTDLRTTATTEWTRAVDQVGQLWHLEGKNVSVLGDSYVVANPNNPEYTIVTVTNGIATLDRPYGVIHVGLPYVSDLQTLDIETAQSETLSDKHKLVSGVSMHIEQSRGIWVGGREPQESTLDGLFELKLRENETYEEPVNLTTDVVDIEIDSEWNSNGRIFVRQIDPLPMTILSVVPSGLIPIRS
jgi:hypothetical protein